ncbi:nudix hydrolase-like protein [Leishmania tarentolae]|uniref:Nudix hydrolase-like protein n=1 Tax=Leishmania tarentolae TaxID=5689 RepID=A0A640KVQ5_LEITA|nr:nudix hydrolase-like protein [Leishmania tarentolae]
MFTRQVIMSTCKKFPWLSTKELAHGCGWRGGGGAATGAKLTPHIQSILNYCEHILRVLFSTGTSAIMKLGSTESDEEFWFLVSFAPAELNSGMISFPLPSSSSLLTISPPPFPPPNNSLKSSSKPFQVPSYILNQLHFFFYVAVIPVMKHSYVRTGLEVVSGLKFTRLCSLSYTDSKHGEHPGNKWEMVQRTTRSMPVSACARSPAPIPVDAVEICAVVRRNCEKFIVVVAQYRPPLDSVCLEFPAGLVDNNETPGQAAIREMYEETGFVVDETDIVSVSPPLSTEPGLTDSCCVVVRFNVDCERVENQNPKQHLDDGEDIEVLMIPISEPKNAVNALSDVVKRYQEKGQRAIVDAKLYTFMEALAWSL